MNLITGSDSYVDIQKRGLGRGRLLGDRIRVPGGLLHAIPAGTRSALCGATPPLIWSEQPWRPEANIGVDICTDCRALSTEQ